MMRIGIEAQRIFRPHKHGMDRVAIELIKTLQRIDTINQYFVFVKDDVDCNVVKGNSNFTIVALKSSPYPYWEQVLLVKAAKEYNLDLLHCTNNTAPIRINIPLVVTIHDIIYMEKLSLSKGTAYQIMGNLYRRWNVARIALRAAHILTVSDFERNNIKDFFRFDENKISTVYNGVGEEFFKTITVNELEQLRVKYRLPQDYILYMGNPDPRKNLKGVLLAVQILNKKGKLFHTLVILGLKKEFVEKTCSDLKIDGIMDHLLFPGYVADEDLAGLYALANLFLYPSLREGFGMPIIEAMAAKTAVITSQTSSMPEVAGDAALLIDPFDPNSIADAIIKLSVDPKQREDLINKGVHQAKNFTWRANAEKTLSIYQRTVG